MVKVLLILMLFMQSMICFSQNKNVATPLPEKKGIIKLHLTNRSKHPLKHQEILLIAKNSKKYYSLFTDNDGIATAKVDPGYNYIIELKTIADTTVYGNIEVPALGENEYFPSPFASFFTIIFPFSYKTIFCLKNAKYIAWKKNNMSMHTLSFSSLASELR